MNGTQATGEQPGRRSRHPGRWLAGLIFVLLLGSAAVVLNSPWMSVRQIEILGAVRADVAGRLAAAGIGDGALMIWLNPGEIEAAVSADPWVREVRVERIFPQRLVVEVLEQTPTVWVAGADSWMLVARTGKVVATAADYGGTYLRAEVHYRDYEAGQQPAGPEWQELADLGLVLGPELAARSTVTREGGELWLEADGCRARLGAPILLAEKGRVFASLLEEGLAPGSSVDLVAPTRPAVTPPEVGEPAG